ncbi:hypothetical protein E2562_031853 [Oryza meyeriana var. granulata]|uniref:F-box domain-containing protein n=1 Tax=Oryza meyeriana var. granulata TaxID=110450 RepID=A0A6G1C1P4_9ORYZ|nr:hypothetical protein E2562_031853 [Oryza meyeriana var. granulata]
MHTHGAHYKTTGASRTQLQQSADCFRVLSMESCGEESSVGGGDRLSALPDDILLDILGNLGVREAGRMAVLSRRWRRLPGLLPRLDIDAREFELAGLRVGTSPAHTVCRVVERLNDAVDSGKVVAGGLEHRATGTPEEQSKRQAARLTRLLAAAASPNLLPSVAELSLVNLRFTAPAFASLLSRCTGLESLGMLPVRRRIPEESPKQLRAMFSKLKSLVLTGIFPGCDLSWTTLLLQAAPSLEEFILMVDKPLAGKAPSDIYREMPKSDDVPLQVPEFQHHNLRRLKFSGFQEEQMHWRLVELVKERAVKLQSIALDDGCQD